MERRRGSRVATWAAALGLLVILGVGYVARDRILETDWCRILDSEDTEDQQEAIRRLAGLGSLACLPQVPEALDAVEFKSSADAEIPAWIREYWPRLGTRAVPRR
jgi:hypothetical protein